MNLNAWPVCLKFRPITHAEVCLPDCIIQAGHATGDEQRYQAWLIKKALKIPDVLITSS
jgi:hypothetical protein